MINYHCSAVLLKCLSSVHTCCRMYFWIHPHRNNWPFPWTRHCHTVCLYLFIIMMNVIAERFSSGYNCKLVPIYIYKWIYDKQVAFRRAEAEKHGKQDDCDILQRFDVKLIRWLRLVCLYSRTTWSIEASAAVAAAAPLCRSCPPDTAD